MQVEILKNRIYVVKWNILVGLENIKKAIFK